MDGTDSAARCGHYARILGIPWALVRAQSQNPLGQPDPGRLREPPGRSNRARPRGEATAFRQSADVRRGNSQRRACAENGRCQISKAYKGARQTFPGANIDGHSAGYRDKNHAMA